MSQTIHLSAVSENEMDDNQETACTTDHVIPVNDTVESPRHSPIKKSAATRLMKQISLFSISTELDHIKPITVLTVQQVVILVSLILLVVIVLQIPTILYFLNPPPSSSTSSSSILSDFNFKTCSVS